MEFSDTHTPKCYDMHPLPGERLANGSRNPDRNGEKLLQEVLLTVPHGEEHVFLKSMTKTLALRESRP